MKNFFTRIIFRERPWLWTAALVLMLLAGFAIRLIDLTDLPLDFAPTRQLFSALKARGMYYQYVSDAPAWQRDQAIALGHVGTFEPPILETLVAQTYRLVGEHLWISRIYTSFFWVLGGLALFLLIRDLTSNGPAVIGTLFYLFVPFGVIASRSFQPDPLMTALIVYFLWALFRWQNKHNWKWALLAGLFGGLAIFIKNTSVFFIVGGFAGVILGIITLKRALRDLQVWCMGVLFILPLAIYMLSGLSTLGSSMQGYLNLQFFPKMLIDPAFYFRWDYTVSYVVGFLTSLLAGLSVFLTDPKRERPLFVGLWLGYLLFGLVFSYAFYTHYYYQLPFIPLVAISFAPAVQVFLKRYFERSPGIFPRLVLGAVILAAVAVQAWSVRNTLTSADYRSEQDFWAEIGDVLGHDTQVVGLTQDYGYRLAYWGLQGSSAWYTSADINVRYMAGQDETDIAEKFNQDITGKQYFLVTMFGEFDAQPAIKDYLYAHYPIFAETDEYIIFDLQHALEVTP
jgi:4-amino-4-deoxy-L-arabinose transferase-like glycosyltransferase